MNRRSFTLIELLIVVAIIAILAAIAVPNFLEAQTRAKISRVKADLRTFGTALEAYNVDYNKYPWSFRHSLFLIHLWQLTTPIAYVSGVNMRDPFMPQGTPDNSDSYRYFNYEDTYWWAPDNDMYGQRAYCLHSYGPDRDNDGAEHFAHRNYPGHPEWGDAQRYALLYNATNGTVSSGDIIYIGGETAFGGGMID